MNVIVRPAQPSDAEGLTPAALDLAEQYIALDPEPFKHWAWPAQRLRTVGAWREGHHMAWHPQSVWPARQGRPLTKRQ